MFGTQSGKSLGTVVLFLATTLATAQTSSSASDWKPVEDAMGRTAQVTGDVIRFGMPRKDLHVTLDGVEIKPALALGSWAAFKKDGNAAMVMGDLVLTESETEPVMAKLQEGGIQESAVHNHLIGESPRILYMHIASHGDPVQMAKAIRDALALTHTPPADAQAAAPQHQNWDSIRNKSSRLWAIAEKSMVAFSRLEFLALRRLLTRE